MHGYTTVHGETYVQKYKLEKWINQCSGCQVRGYKPEMPNEVAQNKYGRGEHAARSMRRFFQPLQLSDRGLCEIELSRPKPNILTLRCLHGGDCFVLADSYNGNRNPVVCMRTGHDTLNVIRLNDGKLTDLAGETDVVVVKVTASAVTEQL